MRGQPDALHVLCLAFLAGFVLLLMWWTNSSPSQQIVFATKTMLCVHRPPVFRIPMITTKRFASVMLKVDQVCRLSPVINFAPLRMKMVFERSFPPFH